MYFLELDNNKTMMGEFKFPSFWIYQNYSCVVFSLTLIILSIQCCQPYWISWLYLLCKSSFKQDQKKSLHQEWSATDWSKYNILQYIFIQVKQGRKVLSDATLFILLSCPGRRACNTSSSNKADMSLSCEWMVFQGELLDILTHLN